MVRRRISQHARSWPLRLALRLLEWSGSLELAVLLILSLGAVLGYATFVESAFGTPAVQFGLYQTWWFNLLNAALALNIFAAAAVRYPWKKHQTGFVITHVGLLTLLLGCWISRDQAIDAQVPIFEGHFGSRAYESAFNLDLGQTRQNETQVTRLDTIPFKPGPFDWSRYTTWNWKGISAKDLGPHSSAKLPTLPWNLATRDRAGDVLLDRDGVKLEVLDFLADAEDVQLPRLTLGLLAPQQQDWQPLTLGLVPQASTSSPLYPFGMGNKEKLGLGSFVFWTLGRKAEAEAFLKCLPEGEVTGKGQAVLWVDGNKHLVPIDARVGQGKFPLHENWEAEVVRWYATAVPRSSGTLKEATNVDGVELVETNPVATAGGDPAQPQTDGQEDTATRSRSNDKLPLFPAVEIKLYRGDQAAGRLLLFGYDPQFNLSSNAEQFSGAYWYRHPQERGNSRCDIAQLANGELVYRSWSGLKGTLVASGPLPLDGAEQTGFVMPIGEMKIKVREFLPALQPRSEPFGRAFDRKKMFWEQQAFARMRLTVDGQTEEFWLQGMGLEDEPRGRQRKVVTGRNRSITLTMPARHFDLGFRVKLNKFGRRLDPGTSQPSHYWSDVEFWEAKSDRVLQKDVQISMNAPQEFISPLSGQNFRLFQESFSGPFKPGDPVYNYQVVNLPTAERRNYDQEIYSSTLTVNVDPGRGLKYLGSAFIVLGIATMFYMKAYFFNKPLAASATETKLPDAAGTAEKIAAAKAAANRGGPVQQDSAQARTTGRGNKSKK